MRILDDSDSLFELMDERMDAVARDMARRADEDRVAPTPQKVGLPPEQSSAGSFAPSNTPATGEKLL